MTRGLYCTIALCILILAAGLRIYRLDHQSFWNDEGNTARLTERSIRLIIEGTASDVHPPLYYLMVGGWRSLLGDSEFSLRLFSAAAGVVTAALVVAVARLAFDRPVALVAGGLAALSPPLVYYGQEARMYALHAVWAMLCTLFLLWGLSQNGTLSDRKGLGRRRFTRPWVIGYILAAAAGWYTHYSFPFVLVAHSLGFLVWLFSVPRSNRGRLVAGWGLILGVILLLYLPWLPIFLGASGRAAAPPALGDYWGRALSWLWAGPTGRLGWSGFFLMTILLFSWGWGFRAGRYQWTRAWPLGVIWLMVVVPVVSMAVVGATTDAFLKFLTAAAPLVTVVAAVGTMEIYRGFIRLRWVRIGPLTAGGMVLAVVWPQIQAVNRLYFDPTTYRDDYRALAAEIERENFPNAGILLSAPNQWEVFTYYYDGPAPVYPYPKIALPAEEVIAGLDEISRDHTRLYGIFWGAAGFDPEGGVERWLESNGYKVIDEFRGDLRYVVVSLPEEGNLEPPISLELTVGSNIALRSAALSPAEVRPGEVIQVELRWEATAVVGRRYKVFLHLVDQNGVLVAQRDGEPAGNARPTTTWAVGEEIVDRHGVLVPLNLPPGEYTLTVGLYDVDNPVDRLTITGPEGSVDAWPLGQFKIADQ